MKTFFKTLEDRFFVAATKIENTLFPYKAALSEANIKDIEWRLQNRPITKSGVLTVTT